MENRADLKRTGILKSVDVETSGGELICRRISTPYYITDGHTVGDVADVFISNSGMQAIGIADGGGKAKGIIARNELFSLIGQKFGRELYLNKSISELVRPVEMIYYKRNTFSVIDEISGLLKSVYNRFYILIDGENRYRGLISTFDLVLFLSEMMTRELKSARRIHSAIVKDEININTGHLSVCGSMLMAGETGGDFHYVKKTGSNRWFISLCDVSGKGLNAGLISVAVSSMFAAYDFNRGVDELIRRINSYIHDLFGGEIFLTGVFIEMDESTGKLEVYDMGHSMFYLFKEDTVTSPASDNGNLPLGITGETEPSKTVITMARGDIIVLYTDGLPEQNNIVNESFGEQRILSLVMKYRNSSPDQVKGIIFDELTRWRSGNAQGDDMSLLMINYK